MSKKAKKHSNEDPYFLQRVLLTIIQAHPNSGSTPFVRLRGAMEALLGVSKTEVDVPWPLPDAEYFEPVTELRLTEMLERMKEELPREQQKGVMSLGRKRTPRAQKIRAASDRLQDHWQVSDPERVLKEGLQAQPTRPLADYMDLYEVLRILSNHGVKVGRQE